jgi:hypothetical protein
MTYEYSKAKRIFSHLKGYDHWMKTVISINQHDKSDIAKYRLRVIKHYHQFGLKSTLNAFPVKRSTLFLWQQKLRTQQGKLTALIPRSTRPHRVRQMMVDYRIIDEIARLRKKHYRLGKQKLKPFLDKFCQQENIQAPSVSLMGKIIKRHNLFYQRPSTGVHDPDRKPYTKKKKLRINKSPKPTQGGYVQADTVETIVLGVRRYTISFIDVKLKIAHSKTFSGKLSKYALECFKEFKRLVPAPIHTIQTDNGSEFEGVFEVYLRLKGIKHVWTYPNCPKINSCIERYNRSIQEEWMESYLNEIDDTIQFNKRLKEYLYFYNNLRVHESLQLKTPAQVVGKELKVQ